MNISKIIKSGYFFSAIEKKIFGKLAPTKIKYDEKLVKRIGITVVMPSDSDTMSQTLIVVWCGSVFRYDTR